MYPGPHDPAGVPLIKAGDLAGNRIGGVPRFRISQAKHEEYRRTALEGGELLMTLVGDVGQCAVVPPSAAGWNAARAVAVMRFQHPADAGFVRLCLLSQPLRHLIDAWSNTTVQATLNLREIRDLPLPWPPPGQRRALTDTLQALDDKIASSRRLSDVIPRLIASVVAETLLESSVSIPVADLAAFVNGGAFTKGATGTGRMVIRIAELNGGPGASTVYTELDVPEDKVARRGDLLMSWSGSLDVYRWDMDEAIINQHIFKVIPRGYPPWLVFERLKSVMPVFQAIAKDKATTMGHIQRGHLASTTVPVPIDSAVARLDRMLEPMWQRLLISDREAQTLTSIRDLLLPELLSGRMQVPEAREAAETG